ncbi:MAG: hypothetical protein PW790_06090 [Parvibaculaceae bacterium]|nr:hypothetical protein [Parvibaculaceae bacterium]
MPGLGLPHEIADFQQQNPDQALLISNEFMFGWPDDYTRDLATALRAFGVTIIAYIRDYREWLWSAYSEEVKRGANARDFDSYARWMADRISAWPALSGWGEHFGWDRIRVRSLDSRSLSEGGLVPDCLRALSLPPDLAGTEITVRSNQSPGWMMAELQRAMARPADGEAWNEEEATAAEQLNQLLAECIAKSPNGGMSAQYLTPDQDRWLMELYNSDAQKISARSGTDLPLVAPYELPERPFLPAINHMPVDIMQAYEKKANARQFLKKFPATLKMQPPELYARLRTRRYSWRIFR